MLDNIINNICNKNDITRFDVHDFRQTLEYIKHVKLVTNKEFYYYCSTFDGLAFPIDGSVAIYPYIDTDYKFLVSLHEIGHVINERNGRINNVIASESLSDLYALRTSKKYHREFNDYNNSIKNYINHSIKVQIQLIRNNIELNKNEYIPVELYKLINNYYNTEIQYPISYIDTYKQLLNKC